MNLWISISFTKLMGGDVILAHRLLKNEISSNEYSLFTESYLNENECMKKNI